MRQVAGSARPRRRLRSASLGSAVLRMLLPAAVAWQACGLAKQAFVAAPGGAATDGRGQARGLRGSSSRTARGFFGGGGPPEGMSYEEWQRQEFDKQLYPMDKRWEKPDGENKLREVFPGPRDFTTVFWAVIQPAASLAFLIVGASIYFETNLVDFNDLTRRTLYFLKPTNQMAWYPQGVFMSFYGFFGLFVFGPLQWYFAIKNPGYGLAEFDKITKRFYIIRDEELQTDVGFEDIEKVVMCYPMLSFGTREIYLTTKNGGEIHWMKNIDDNWTKTQLERRAVELSEFLGKELAIEDQ